MINKRMKRQNNTTKIVGIWVGAFAIAFAFGCTAVSNKHKTESATVVRNERLDDGSIVQELGSADGEKSLERRIGLADEAWFKTKKGVTTSYFLTVVGKGMILSEFDVNADGKIDEVIMRLVDGRRIVYADNNFDGKFKMTTSEK